MNLPQWTKFFAKIRIRIRIHKVSSPWIFGTDPDPRIRTSDFTDPDPALFVSDLQDVNKKVFAYSFLKVHLHHFSTIKSHKQETK